MANVLTANPLVISVDIANFNTTQVLNGPSGYGNLGGLRVTKMALLVGASASSAGSVTVTDPTTGNALLQPLLVPAGVAAGQELYSADFTGQESNLIFANFAVTGVTATGTVLYLWVR